MSPVRHLRFALIFSLALLLPSLASDEDWAFLKSLPGKPAKKGEPADSSGAKMVWIKLTPFQLDAIHRKSHIQNKQLRQSSAREEQLFPIELTDEQVMAVRRLLERRLPYRGKITLRTIFSELKPLETTRGSSRFAKSYYIVRSVEQFERPDPSDSSSR